MLLNSLKCPYALFTPAHNVPPLNTRMPTEREQETLEKLYKEGHFKEDRSGFRMPFMDRIEPCLMCNRIRTVIIYSLACYGLYSLFF